MVRVEKILVCNERDLENDGHVALNEQLEALSSSMKVSIHVSWMHPKFAMDDILAASGIIIPNGITNSFEGQVACCKGAREAGIPLLGICGGLQAAAIDVARHLAGLPEANSVEHAPATSMPLVYEDGHSCTRSPQLIRLIPGRYLADLYGSETLEGMVRCGRFVNWQYWSRLEQAGLELLATDAYGKRILGFRLVDHPFYLGVAFLPQFNTTFTDPEPLLSRFIRVASSGTSYH
jgi:CTP synthase